MSKSNDSIKKTLTVAFLLCLVCSVIVSGAAVALKPLQVANQEHDRRTNILVAAGLIQPREATRERVNAEFDKIQVKVVDLRTGQYVDHINPNEFDQLRAAAEPATSERLAVDPAGIRRLEHYGLVYLVGDVDNPDRIIIPVRGSGLWSTLYGFLALEGDGSTIAGLGFYQHAETPGLGGEVDNANWKAQWPGKRVFAEDSMQPRLGLASNPDPDHQVDTLAGATLTARGVTNLLQFWTGERGYGPFLAKFRQGV
ncbi:Na(+)-translocating NADH-quinone reductase subunit C [Marinospirillum alkaliphilum]|uniref:Na(+)-translocating NADH-quinone reductase subunit C n=1 Tax=Marinospirillum alkaliphilum DSM 21637 TaxID=1122209 RepID=A0A1K1U5P1_9GAMM|nr:Na(+)-translocating NADH-quinone reductase subunit C [Marinospirillum alkaliphilum]SFX08174.1 Na+-transporting NADH:ubiquinone oxidoreductase subunit C [Marinospirillum alkaliphilum DSM 21637]